MDERSVLCFDGLFRGNRSTCPVPNLKSKSITTNSGNRFSIPVSTSLDLGLDVCFPYHLCLLWELGLELGIGTFLFGTPFIGSESREGAHPFSLSPQTSYTQPSSQLLRTSLQRLSISFPVRLRVPTVEPPHCSPALFVGMSSIVTT